MSLTAGTASGGAGSDTLIAIENVTGTNFADTITGSSGVNILSGGDGNDFISGGLGSDFISGNAGKDTLLGGADNDIDTFAFTSFSDSLLANFDTIGDFTGFDIIDRPGQLAASLNTSNGIAAGLLASQVSAILNNFSFTANSTRPSQPSVSQGLLWPSMMAQQVSMNSATASCIFPPSTWVGRTQSPSLRNQLKASPPHLV